ncbi:hypothetical protein QYF36_005237 [Acer negundo]|nr:hypothetical protein QYF36_005237 [Acer negundo]
MVQFRGVIGHPILFCSPRGVLLFCTTGAVSKTNGHSRLFYSHQRVLFFYITCAASRVISHQRLICSLRGVISAILGAKNGEGRTAARDSKYGLGGVMPPALLLRDPRWDSPGVIVGGDSIGMVTVAYVVPRLNRE